MQIHKTLSFNSRKFAVNLFAILLTLMLLYPTYSSLNVVNGSKSVAPQNDGEESLEIDLKNPLKLSNSLSKSVFSAVDREQFAITTQTLKDGGKGQLPITEQSGTRNLVYFFEFKSARAASTFKLPGAKVFNRYQQFADIYVPVPNDWQNLSNSEIVAQIEDQINVANRACGSCIIRMEFAKKVIAPPLPPSMPTNQRTLQPAETIIHGGYQGVTGKGVIIAIVDGGVDFRNPDFITYDAANQPTSRLLYLWDTTSNAFDRQKLGNRAPITFPNGASVGTLYTQQQLTNELRSNTKQISETDIDGHGTACAGIAAGNGNNGNNREEVKGVAPEADIIAVRIGASEGSGLENAYLFGAINDWLDKVAGRRPLIISCSFGGHGGSGHDGMLIPERQLNARFSLARRGRAIITAAGNEATDNIHGEVTFRDQAAPGLIPFNSPQGSFFFLYFDTGDVDELQIFPARGTTAKVRSFEINSISKKAVAIIHAQSQNGGLYLCNKSGNQMTTDIYNFDGALSSKIIIPGKQIATPGTSENAITVGSYDWNDEFKGYEIRDFCGSKSPLTIGGISCYSNPGFSRSGTIKPEITAPGQFHIASYAQLVNGKGVNIDRRFIDESGKYRLFNGTSAATPYVAGVVALMMQLRPQITLNEIKSLMKQHATQDNLTGKVPNPKYGYGKLNLIAIDKILTALKATPTTNKPGSKPGNQNNKKSNRQTNPTNKIKQ